MPTETKHTALHAYMVESTAALALIERIAEALGNHDDAPTPEELHWGHVAVMAQARRELTEISDRMFAEGEYAPEAK
jgi:hypothetical protein